MSDPVVSPDPTGYRAAITAEQIPKVNADVARSLIQFAELLEKQGAQYFRIQAYRKASMTIRELDEPVDKLLEREGREGLTALPTIGVSIASAIAEMVMTGHWTQLDRISGELSPEKLFKSIPGVGDELADRFCDELLLETLEDLETALKSSDVTVKGLGPRRREGILAVLASRLGHSPNVFHGIILQPSEEMVLEIDEQYRNAVAADELPLITPKRNNPKQEAWLPIMHAVRENWHFTVMYSNTTRAFQAGKTKDWVVVMYQADGQPEGRCTVITEVHGRHRGRRVVRGLGSDTAAVRAY